MLGLSIRRLRIGLPAGTGGRPASDYVEMEPVVLSVVTLKMQPIDAVHTDWGGPGRDRPKPHRGTRLLPLPRNRPQRPAHRTTRNRKNHLAVGPARKAAETGYRTYFTTAADRAARCHRAAMEGRWATTMRFFAGPTLLVIDELGYLPLPAEASSALYQVVNQRYMKTSIVITTNRGIGGWDETLGDATVAAAMLDRLLHRSVVLNLDGDSHRLRDHQARADTLRQAVAHTEEPLT